MSALLRRPTPAREISEVNVVPLADVSLVLLIILLVLSPMMTQARLQVQAAGKSADAAPPPPAWEPVKPPEPVLAVALGPSGLSVGDKTFADPADFRSFLSRELAAREDKKVFLAPTPETPHGSVVRALELIKASGAASVALVQTQEEPSALPSPAPAP